MKKTVGIYQIVNVTNGHRYVGSSVDINERQGAHFRLLRRGRHHSPALQAAWDKYGSETFSFEVVLRECQACDRLILEQAEINEQADCNAHYDAANSLDRTGMKHTLETRRKMSRASRGKPKSAEHKKRIAEAHLGMKANAATRRKISEGAKERCKNRLRDGKGRWA